MLDPGNKTAKISHFLQPASNSASSEKNPVQIQPGVSTSRTASVPAADRKQPAETETKEVEGFTVSVMRRTYTVPAGEKGNEKPLVSSSESWYSKELSIALLTISESPESGKYLRKLTNIHTGDPDPLLFQVPADFTVKESPEK